MRHALYLAWRALAARRLDTAILAGSIALILFVPAGTRVLVARSSAELTARAASTPFLVGARGSALELTLSALYLESEPPESTHHGEVERIARSGLAEAIPLYLRFQARAHPIVGTTLDYLDFRALRVVDGRDMAMLGECVLGATAAHELGLGPGDTVVSAPENAFDLAGVYPLEMTVVGVLAPSGSPDDRAIFTDLKTTWVIEGLGHGHEDLSDPDASAAVLSRRDGNVTANASVRQYQRITATNAATFHFHGDPESFPVSAVIALPHDERSATILLGRYLSDDDSAQIVRPLEVMQDLIATVSNVEAFVIALSALVGLAAAATATLVFGLSLRLRRREIETLDLIGATRARVVAIYGLEIAIVLVLGVLIAAALTGATAALAPALLRALLAA